MRRLRMLGAVVVLALVAAGCATAYGPKNATGGYIEDWRSPTEVEVAFHHNSYMTVETAHKLARRRAAELALEGGHRYLRIWGDRLHRQKVAGPQYAVVQALFLDGREDGALDALAVIHDTDALAQGKLSAQAREQMRKLNSGPRSNSLDPN